MSWFGFGGGGGGGGTVEDTLKSILTALGDGSGVSDAAWKRCLEADGLEESLAEGLPLDRMRVLTSASPDTCFDLCVRCVKAMEESLPAEKADAPGTAAAGAGKNRVPNGKSGKEEEEEEDGDEDDTESLNSEAELTVTNAIVILTHILASGPRWSRRARKAPARHPLLDLIWAKPQPGGSAAALGAARPLGERIADAALRSLFVDGLTIELGEGPEAGDDDEEDSAEDEAADAGARAAGSSSAKAKAAERARACTAGAEVDPRYLWEEGVGPEAATEGGGPGQADENISANRQLGLSLLAALLLGGSPSRPPVDQESDKEDEDSDEDEDKVASKPTPPKRKGNEPAPAPGSAAEQEEKVADARASIGKSVVPLVGDLRALAYLCNRKRPVPRRAELFYSLMNVALAYNPSGLGVPFAGYFSGTKGEQFAHLCLQMLGVLLQHEEDASVDARSAFVFSYPQLERAKQRRGLDGGQRRERQSDEEPQVFRSLLDSCLRTDNEVDFVVEGVARLLGEAKSFTSELLVLLFHLSARPAFAREAARQEEIGSLVESVLHAAVEAPENVPANETFLLAWTALLRLTSHREVCVACIEDFTGAAPDHLPNVKGSIVDLLWIAALQFTSECFATSKVNELHRLSAEAALGVLVNLAPFAEEIGNETCLRFFALLERCGRSMVRKRNSGGAQWLLYLLEALLCVVQYHYPTNRHLTYGMATRFSGFKDLFAVACGGMPAGTSGTSTPRSEASCDTSPLENGLSASFASDLQGQQWQDKAKALLEPILCLLDEIVPPLEAEVEKRETVGADEAKEFLPTSVLGLLPPPPSFALRGLRGNERTHRACEHLLVACISHGPLGEIWDGEEVDDDDDGDGDNDEGGQTTANNMYPSKFTPLPRVAAAGASSPLPPPPPTAVAPPEEASAGAGAPVLTAS